VKSKEALSHVLLSLAGDTGRERILMRDILHAMQDRALVALIVLLALPNVVPVPPGTSAVLGMPLLFLTLQLALGRKPWLPESIAMRSVSRRDFGVMLNRVSPWLDRAEQLLRPRLQVMTGTTSARWVGGLCLVLSTILVLPIPFGNMLPALAIGMLALGILERDGLWVLGGLATSIVAMAVAAGVLFGLAKAAVGVLGHLSG
jgi:hypothetical protein